MRISHLIVLVSAFSLVCDLRAQQADAPRSASPLTLRADARLVVVDVAVADSSGNPVKGLKKEDFSLTEGKTQQTLVNFEEHDATPPATPSTPPNPPGVFANYGGVPLNSPLNILLLDSLNTQLQDQAFIRRQLLQYLDHARPGTHTAIFGLNGRLIQLQGFSDDPATLKRALEHKLPQASAILDSPGGDQPGGESMSDILADQSPDSDLSPQLLRSVATFEAQVQSFQTQARVRLTLDELNQLARYLAGFPGRKNLLWFSASFPINVLPDTNSLADTFAGDFSFQEEYRETANLLGRSQVAVYPIDARGLMVSPAATAPLPPSKASRPGGHMQASTSFFNDTVSTQGTMLDMANDTGGHAFVNTNALDKAVASAIEMGSHYYTLTYSPNQPATHDDYRAIHIKLADSHRSDKLAYRHGYYLEKGFTPEQASAPRLTLTPRQAAGLFGAPAATQILFRARVAPLASTSGGTPTPNRTYVILYHADPSSLTRVSLPDGSSTSMKVRFVALVYDNRGKLVNSASNTVPAVLSPAQLASLSHGSIQYQQQITVPREGAYTLRILVDDMLGSRLGALEVPIAAVKNLPEVDLAQPAATK